MHSEHSDIHSEYSDIHSELAVTTATRSELTDNFKYSELTDTYIHATYWKPSVTTAHCAPVALLSISNDALTQHPTHTRARTNARARRHTRAHTVESTV